VFRKDVQKKEMPPLGGDGKYKDVKDALDAIHKNNYMAKTPLMAMGIFYIFVNNLSFGFFSQ
jgi:hypothetical protein